MKKAVSLILASALCFATIAGCQQKPAANASKNSPTVSAGSEVKKVEIKVVTSYGGDDGNRKNYEKAYKAYESSTGNTVKDASATENEQWKVQIMNDFKMGSEPDVLFFFNGADSNTIVSANKVVSIDEIRAKYPDYATNMRDELLGASPVDGKNYSVPVNGYWESMFVNKKVLADCGVAVPGADYTWDQFLKDCEQIKAKGYTPIACSLAEVPNYWFEFCTYNYLTPKELNTMPKTADDKFGKAWISGLNDIKTLYEKGYFPKNTTSAKDEETCKLMTSNKAAFLIDGSWKVGYFEQNMKDDLSNIVMAYPPSNGGPRKTTDSIGGISMGYYITKKAWDNPEKQKACVDFVKAMTSDETVSSFCSAGNLSALKNGTTPSAEASVLVKSVTEMTKKITGVSPAVEDNMDNQTVRTPFFADVQKMVSGQLPIDKAVADVLVAQEKFIARTVK
jgi:raffinose/stachyose/melibiose transport system substrate-binding protein